MRGSNILGRSLSLFPLWPLVLGVTSGILSADYYGTQHWVAITLISIAGILAFRRSDITLFIVTFMLASGLHGPKIENLRAWSHAADTGKLNGAYTLKGVIIATGSQTKRALPCQNKQNSSDISSQWFATCIGDGRAADNIALS